MTRPYSNQKNTRPKQHKKGTTTKCKCDIVKSSEVEKSIIEPLPDNSNVTEEHDFPDATTDIHKYVKAVVKALQIGADRFLLGVVWVTKEGQIGHIRHPQVLGTDVTFGENREKRHHIGVIGKNEHN